MSESIDDTVEAIAAEARTNFGLRDRLNNKRKYRPKQLILVTDEETAEALGGTRPKYKEISGYRLEDGIHTWGVLGEIHELQATNIDGANDEQIAELEEEAAELKATLLESAIEIDLTGIPPIIERDARRVAKKALGIKGKNIPEELVEKFEDREAAEMLVSMTVRMKDRATGDETTTIESDDALALNDLLPKSELMRLARAIGDLRFANVVSDAATEQVDFS